MANYEIRKQASNNKWEAEKNKKIILKNKEDLEGVEKKYKLLKQDMEIKSKVHSETLKVSAAQKEKIEYIEQINSLLKQELKELKEIKKKNELKIK